MKNGSLQDLSEKVSQGTTELDWLTRNRIASGVAAGLEFPHFNHHKKVIHRDLKRRTSSWTTTWRRGSRISEEDTHTTSTSVVGTLGYIAPEYHSTLKFTEKSDMYSYGVLLAALVIGKLPSDKFFQKTLEIGMVKWLRKVKGGNGGEADGEWVRVADDAGAGSGLILLPGGSQTETQ